MELSPAVYSAFTKPCIIDCNDVHEYTIDDLVNMRGKYDLKTKPEMANAIVDTLRRAVIQVPRSNTGPEAQSDGQSGDGLHILQDQLVLKYSRTSDAGQLGVIISA